MILERYIIREILLTVLVVFALLILLYVSSTFTRFLGDAAQGKIAATMIYKLLGFKIITSLQKLIPLCVYLATFATLVRMRRDQELMAMQSASLGINFTMKTVAKLAIAVALLAVLPLSFFGGPQAKARLMELRETAKSEAKFAGVAAGRFTELGSNDKVLYTESISDDGREVNNVFIRVNRKDTQGVLKSQRAYMHQDDVSGSRYVVFTDGIRYEGMPGDLGFKITSFEKYALRITEETEKSRGYGTGAQPTATLLHSADLHEIAELQWRYAMPIATFLLPLLAVLVATRMFSDSWHMGLLAAILAYFLYVNMLGIGRALIKSGTIPTALGLWWVHLLLILTILAWLYLPWWLRRKRVSKQQILTARDVPPPSE